MGHERAGVRLARSALCARTWPCQEDLRCAENIYADWTMARMQHPPEKLGNDWRWTLIRLSIGLVILGECRRRRRRRRR